MTSEQPELLLFDLDGTLLDNSRQIRPRSLEVLRALKERGVRVGFSSGRSPRSVQPYVDLLEPNGPLILLNGCVLWDPDQRAVVESRKLSRVDAIRAVRAVVDLDIHANVYIGDDLFVARRGPLSIASEKKDGVPHTEVANLLEFVSRHEDTPFKLLCIQETGDFTPLLQRLETELTSGCTLVNSEPTYLEILPPSVNKGMLVHHIGEHYGIAAHQIAAFGDELNDVDLLRTVGQAVVMGNGNRNLRRLVPDAHYIGDNESDAIADFLIELFQLGEGPEGR